MLEKWKRETQGTAGGSVRLDDTGECNDATYLLTSHYYFCIKCPRDFMGQRFGEGT